MKKSLLFVLAIGLVLGAIGCGSAGEEVSSEKNQGGIETSKGGKKPGAAESDNGLKN